MVDVWISLLACALGLVLLTVGITIALRATYALWGAGVGALATGIALMVIGLVTLVLSYRFK